MDAEFSVIGNGGIQEGDGALFALIGHDLHEGDARGIVNADVNVFPTDAEVAIDHARLPSGDAVPHRANTAELLDIDVDEFARVLALVAPDRFGWLQGAELVQAERTQNPANGRW